MPIFDGFRRIFICFDARELRQRNAQGSAPPANFHEDIRRAIEIVIKHADDRDDLALFQRRYGP